MKLVVLIFMLILHYACADGMRSCITDANCESDECCISLAFVRGFCHTLGKEGEHCIDKPAETEYGKKNLFGCPCSEGYRCVAEVTKEGDITVHKNPTCKAETK